MIFENHFMIFKNHLKFTEYKRLCVSEWGTVPSGVPQGTKQGHWLFLIMINDLIVSTASIWKYLDDTTLSEVIKNGQHSEAQGIVNEVENWSIRYRVKLNTDKCKELCISFTSDCDFPPVVIGEECIKLVKDAKLLGVTISGDLTWNAHITEVTKKSPEIVTNKSLASLTNLMHSSPKTTGGKSQSDVKLMGNSLHLSVFNLTLFLIDQFTTSFTIP